MSHKYFENSLDFRFLCGHDPRAGAELGALPEDEENGLVFLINQGLKVYENHNINIAMSSFMLTQPGLRMTVLKVLTNEKPVFT